MSKDDDDVNLTDEVPRRLESDSFLKLDRPIDKRIDAIRYDDGKLPYELISGEFLNELSEALLYGKTKYSAHNWMKGMDWSRSFGALQRHLWKWWRGEDIDEESGCNHLALAAANLMFLTHYSKVRKYSEYDNRMKY